jgi:hypothetical protein
MMRLKGKDYLQVMWRLVWFREDHPDWSIDANILEADAEHAVFKAVICDENGVQKCSGHGSESKRDFGDFLEKAETKAVGRALAMLGYGTQFTATELDEGERIVDSPVNRGTGSTEAAQEVGRAKLAELEGKLKPAETAAPGQIQYILEHATESQLKKLRAEFGENLERMPRARAEKGVEHYQGASA